MERRRAFQTVGNDAEVGIEIRNFAGTGRRVLLRAPERLEFVDAAGHAADPVRYRTRCYAMKGNRIAVAFDWSMEMVEVHPPSANRMEMVGLVVDNYPPRPAMG